MNLKKITALMIGAIRTVSMAVPAMADDKVETVTDGKLTVATSPDFAPYEFYSIDEDGNPTLAGFDMDLAKYIADKMGLELEVVPMDFDGVLSELSQKNVDLGMAGLSPDPAREDAMDFSDLYYKGGQSFVSVKDKADEFKSLEDANNKDYSIGAQTGSIQLDLANENTPDADIVSLPKVTDIITELLTGTQILEFIDMEHTPKNLLIRAVKTGRSRSGEALKEMTDAIHGHLTLEKLLYPDGFDAKEGV